jgi:hypothetical protein
VIRAKYIARAINKGNAAVGSNRMCHSVCLRTGRAVMEETKKRSAALLCRFFSRRRHRSAAVLLPYFNPFFTRLTLKLDDGKGQT